MRLVLLFILLMNAIISSATPCCEELAQRSFSSASKSDHSCCHESGVKNKGTGKESSPSQTIHLGQCDHPCCSLYSMTLTGSEIEFELNSNEPFLKSILTPKHVFLSVPKRPPRLV